MKLLLEIKDDKATFILELLRNFKFVKVKKITSYKTKILEDIEEAVEELNEIKSNRKEAQPLSTFLNEL